VVDAKSKARVGRLLHADFRPDDLQNLFIYARDHCDGRRTITDIGAFVAHHNERNKGIVTQSTRDWFAVARYHASAHGSQLDWRKMPPTTRDYFRIAANRIEAKLIRDKTGLKQAKANKIMNELAGRLTQNADGTWTLPTNLSADERSLVQCVSSVLVVKPAFEANRLYEDFTATLRSNGLITGTELSTHGETLRALVELFAVAAMHNCVIQVGDGTTTRLKAKPEPDVKQIWVNAPVPGAVPNQPRIIISCSMFTADVDPAASCHPDLVANQDWDFEIELSPDKRLSRL
jgi:hypothetical protein